MLRLSLYLFLWLTSMAIAIFATQNTSLVNLRLFNFESIKLPLGLLLVFCGGLGAVFINFWQTSISFALPNLPIKPTTSLNNQTSKNQSFTKPTDVKKDISKPNSQSNSNPNNKPNNNKDNFDEGWEDDWE
jgi:hypothetical protein